MREPVDSSSILKFMEEIGKRATTPGTIYFTGGASALPLGIRYPAIDADDFYRKLNEFISRQAG
jgi:hypothetical protein